MQDITDLMNSYKECARNLWNVYFSRRPNYGTSEDAFGDISRRLFDSLVLDELVFEDPPEGDAIPPPFLRVVPGVQVPILIADQSEPGKSTYWGVERDLFVGPDDIEAIFTEYFDFRRSPIKDFRYYECKILKFPAHPEYVGRRCLLETLDCRVYNEE
jgi:hypothetical protein